MPIFDYSKVTRSDPSTGDKMELKYKDGLLSFSWDSNGQSPRVYSPGNMLVHDKNTLERHITRDAFRIVQRIQRGPNGSFILPSYRKISDSDFLYFKDRSVDNL